MRGRQPRGDTLFNCWHLSFYRSLSGVARIFKLWSCDESSSRRVLSRNGLHWKRFMLYASEYVRYDVLMRIYVMCNSEKKRRMGVMRERERWKGPFCIYFVISFQFLSYLPTLKYFLLGCNSIHIFHDNFFGLLFNSIFIMKRKPSYNLYNSKTVLFLITRGQWPYRRAGQQGQ